jgi:hypothetical protein
MKSLLLAGIVLLLTGLYLAFIQHSTIWYSFFVIGGFLLFEGLNKYKGFSVLKYPKKFLLIWFYFILITIVVEIIGNYWLDMWDYPTYGIWEYLLHIIIIGYPFAFFGGLGLFVYIQKNFPLRQKVMLPIVAILFGYVNEIPNLYAHVWIYKNWPFGDFLRIPVSVSILLWGMLLAVLTFKRFFLKQ